MKRLTMILAAAPVAVCTGQQVAARFHVPVRNSEGRDTGSAVTRLTGPFLEATRGVARMFQDPDVSGPGCFRTRMFQDMDIEARQLR